MTQKTNDTNIQKSNTINNLDPNCSELNTLDNSTHINCTCNCSKAPHSKSEFSQSTPQPNLLIIGVGGHGRVCYETARAMNVFAKIDFLDDCFCNNTKTDCETKQCFCNTSSVCNAYPFYNDLNANNSFSDVQTYDAPRVVGKLSDAPLFTSKYTYAFVGIGDNKLRLETIDTLQSLGYKIPVLIHPNAFVSPTASIDNGSIITAHAVVNREAKLGKACILSVGAIVDHNATLEDAVHANAGSICKAGSVIKTLTKLQAGEVVLGY